MGDDACARARIAAAFALATCLARPARADDTRLPSFRYTRPAEPDAFRATLEGVGVLGIGFMEYLVSTEQSRGHIEPAYDWTIFRDKLGGDAQSFDINRFNTNFVGHPIGGTLYYTAARSNRLPFWDAFAWAFAGSLLWEYLGEITEKPSYNDMIVTPWAGLACGETFHQLGTFFGRGERTVGNTVLAWFFSTARHAHDAVDDVRLERAKASDALGFAADVAHRFELSLGVARTRQQSLAGEASRSYDDARMRLDARVWALPCSSQPCSARGTFRDGEVSRLSFELAASESGLTHASFATRSVLAGVHARSAGLGPRGDVLGHGGYVGLVVGFDYTTHDYDRDRAHTMDQLASVTLAGVAGEYLLDAGPLRIRTRLDASFDFAGVRAYALDAYVRQRLPDQLPTVVRAQGYGFDAGPSIDTEAGIEAYGASLTGRLRVRDFHAILGLDDDETRLTHDVPRADRRTRANVALSYTAPVERLRVAIEGDAFAIRGAVGAARASRSEASVALTLGAVF